MNHHDMYLGRILRGFWFYVICAGVIAFQPFVFAYAYLPSISRFGVLWSIAIVLGIIEAFCAIWALRHSDRWYAAFWWLPMVLAAYPALEPIRRGIISIGEAFHVIGLVFLIVLFGIRAYSQRRGNGGAGAF